MQNDNQAEIVRRLHDRQKEQELSYDIAQQMAAVQSREEMVVLAQKILTPYLHCAEILAFISCNLPRKQLRLLM